MSGSAETNLNANKNTMANSLLSAAAAHPLIDEDNLLLLQDVSLHDEPEAPDTSKSGAFPDVDIINPVFGLSSFPPPTTSAVAEPGPINASSTNEFKVRELDFRRDVLGEASTALKHSLEPSSSREGSADVQPLPSVSSLFGTDTNQSSNFASSLFQTTDSGKHDPFQVSIRPPPTLASMPKVVASHSPFMPPLAASQAGPSIPSFSAAYNRESNVGPAPVSTAKIPYSSVEHNASAIAKSEINLGHTSTASIPLFTPSLQPELNVPSVRSVASSPALLNDPRFTNTLATTTNAQAPLPQAKPATYGSSVATNIPPNNDHGGSERPTIPLFTPSGGNLTTQPQLPQPPPPATIPNTSSSMFNPNAVITTNSPFDGFTVLPPQGSSQHGSNQFRMTTQKPAYAQYPGINSSGMSSQFPAMDFSRPLAKLTDPQPPVSESLYPALPGQESLQYDPNMSQQHGFGGPVAPKQEIFPYYPPEYFWWYNREVDGKNFWKPFSIADSYAIEEAFNKGTKDLVCTDGGRYDVNIAERVKIPVYWEEPQKTFVRRCSWYYKGPLDSRFVPYDEEFSAVLEAEFYQTMTTGFWHKRMELGGGEVVVFHSPIVMVHFCQAASPDEWGNMPENQLRPRVVKRGIQEVAELEEGESEQIDHLVLIVHGIGSICDFKFRNPVEAVDEFRLVSQQLSGTHFRGAINSKKAGRLEFLPIQWHAALHGEGGADEKLKLITLNSIPKLRSFTNDTLLDILFYTSPVYTQTVVSAVGNEINRIYNLFKSRHSQFTGMVALGGHSLGSLIIFDILMKQPETLPDKGSETPSKSEGEPLNVGAIDDENDNATVGPGFPVKKTRSRTVTYEIGNGGTGIQLVNYPILQFHPTAFFAMGSPVAVFVTVRGLEQLGTDCHFPTVPSFYNIFHPYDPVAYRMEPLVDPSFDLRPVLIPHHKGRKRFHLELKETMARVGSDIKNKVMESLKTTWNTVYQYASFGRSDTINEDIDRAIEGELQNQLKESDNSVPESEGVVRIGRLNGGNRIDYVLQESPMETLNEYLFALASHVCYWSSEDTVLLILKELYKKLDVHADASVANITTSPQSTIAASLPPIYNPTAYKAPEPPGAAPGPNVLNKSNYSTYGASVAPSAPPLFIQAETTQSPAPPMLFNSMSYNSQITGAPAQSNSSGKVTLVGARPVVSPEQFPIATGMDPTAPISSNRTVGPPPLTGFVGSRKQ